MIQKYKRWKNQRKSLVAIKSIWWKINLTPFHSPTHSLFKCSRFICFFRTFFCWCSCCSCWALVFSSTLLWCIYIFLYIFIPFYMKQFWILSGVDEKKKLKWKSILDFIALKLDHIEESFFFHFVNLRSFFSVYFFVNCERKWERKNSRAFSFFLFTLIFFSFLSWYFSLRWIFHCTKQYNCAAIDNKSNNSICFIWKLAGKRMRLIFPTFITHFLDFQTFSSWLKRRFSFFFHLKFLNFFLFDDILNTYSKLFERYKKIILHFFTAKNSTPIRCTEIPFQISIFFLFPFFFTLLQNSCSFGQTWLCFDCNIAIKFIHVRSHTINNREKFIQ